MWPLSPGSASSFLQELAVPDFIAGAYAGTRASDVGKTGTPGAFVAPFCVSKGATPHETNPLHRLRPCVCRHAVVRLRQERDQPARGHRRHRHAQLAQHAELAERAGGKAGTAEAHAAVAGQAVGLQPSGNAATSGTPAIASSCSSKGWAPPQRRNFALS